MKSNAYYQSLSYGIFLCLTLPCLINPLSQSTVDFWLRVVDEFHECGMHRIAHKVDEAVCNVVEKCGVEK